MRALRPWGKEQWEKWRGVGLGGRGAGSNSQTSLSGPFQTPLSACTRRGAMLWAPRCNTAAPSHWRVLHLAAAVTTAAASMPYLLVPDTVDAHPAPPFPRMLTTSHSLPLPCWTCSCPFSLCSRSHKSPGLISAWLQGASAFLWVSQCKFPLNCLLSPTRRLGTDILLLPSSQISHFPGSSQILRAHKSVSQTGIFSSAFRLLCQPAQLQQ